jgi:hypothetical protein
VAGGVAASWSSCGANDAAALRPAARAGCAQSPRGQRARGARRAARRTQRTTRACEKREQVCEKREQVCARDTDAQQDSICNRARAPWA